MVEQNVFISNYQSLFNQESNVTEITNFFRLIQMKFFDRLMKISKR